MTLAEFIAWFRNDLAYKAPEVWHGHVEWFLRELTVRYGDATEKGDES